MRRGARERIEIRRSTLPDRNFAIRNCERGSESRYLNLDCTQEHYERFADDIGESKRLRYSYHDTEETFRDPPDQGYDNALSFEENHDPRRYRSTGSRLHHEGYAHWDDFFDDVRYMERDEPRRVNSVICKFFAEGYCKKGEDCNFSHQDDYRADGRFRDGYESMERTYDRIDSDVSFRRNESHRVNDITCEYQDDSWDHGEFIERDELEERTYGRSDLDVSSRRRSESRRVNNTPCKFFAEGYCKRGGDCNFSHHDNSHDNGRFMEGYETKERTYDRSDLDASVQRIGKDLPCKYFAEGYCKRGEDCSFSHQEPLGRSSDRKRGHAVETGPLSRKGPMRGDERTGGRYDHGRQRCYSAKSGNCLSRNVLKYEDDSNLNRGKQRKIVGSLDSSLRRLDDDRSDYNGKFGERFSRNGWEGDQATATDATSYGKRGSKVRVPSTLSWDGPKWGDQIIDSEVPVSSKWDSDIKFNNEQLWGGPKSSQLGSDADPWDNKARTSRDSSCNESKWGGIVTKEASWNDSGWGKRRKIELGPPSSLSANGPKWGKQRKIDKSPNFHPRKGYNTRSGKQFSPNDAKGSEKNSGKRGNNVRIGSSSSGNGSKWGDQATKESSWNGPKCGDQTTKETSWDSWGDKTKKETHAVKSSKIILNDDKWNNSAKNENSVSWDGPKWGEKVSTQRSPDCSLQKTDCDVQDRIVKTDQISSQDVSKEGDEASTKDETGTKDAYVTRQGRSGNNQCGSNNESDPLAQRDASDSSMPRSEDAGSRASACDSAKIKSSSDVHQHKSSRGNSEEALFSGDRNLQNLTRQKSGIDWQDTVPQPSPSQRRMSTERQNDQVVEKSEQPHLPVTLKSPIAAAKPFQPDNTNPKGNVHISIDRSMEASEVATGKITYAPRNTHPEDVDARLKVGGAWERIKDEEGIRMLKFALVEFVKDILKPYWQDGRLTKEDHKIIAKKVVDKVIGTLQAPAIPRSQENVDHYMSFSKTKITGLVMAYLEIYSKKN